MDYKKYSLEQLENWVHDAINGDASPHEIYSTIRTVVKENLDHHKEYHQKCLGLYELLSGHRPVNFECDKDDPSPECVKVWDSFWENNEVEAIRQTGGYEWTPEPKVSDKYETKNIISVMEIDLIICVVIYLVWQNL